MSLGEPTDDLFKYVTHLKIGDVVGMQIRLSGGKFFEHDVENIFLRHRSDVSVKFEFLYDLLNIGRKPIEIVTEVCLDVIRIIKQTLKGKFTRVIELIP